jgi:hypothetical protein
MVAAPLTDGAMWVSLYKRVYLSRMSHIAAERGWDERFAKTQDQLGVLVRAARAEVARGEAVSRDPSDRPVK